MTRKRGKPDEPVHVVQVSYDASIVSAVGSDAGERQRRYARALGRLRPGSRWTVLTVTDGRAMEVDLGDGAWARAVPARRPGRVGALVAALRALDDEAAISVIATQTPAEDGWAALWFARRGGPPVIAQVHFDLFSPLGVSHAIGGGWRGKVRRWLMWRAMGRYAAVRTVGRRTAAMLAARRPGLAVQAIPVASGWEVAAAGLGEGEEGGEGVRRVLFVGRLVAEKNLEGWLRVAGRVSERWPTARFDVVGDGPLRAGLESAARGLELADRVTFHGQRPTGALDELYRQADVFMLLSHCEGFGRVVVEAQRHGLPTVCTRINGVEDIVEDERTGLLVEPGDEEAAASAVCRLLADASLRERMGQAGRMRMAELFEPQMLIERWVEMLVTTAEGGEAALVYSRPRIGGNR